MAAKLLRKQLESKKDSLELELVDGGLKSIQDIPEIFGLKSLTRLSLAHNKLKVLPSELGLLLTLESLTLSFNNFEEVPSAVTDLTNLRNLNLSFNRITVLPRALCKLSSLETLDATANRVTLSGLHFLQALGSLSMTPESRRPLDSLRALYLSDNYIEALPAQIGLLPSLEILAVRDNDLAALPPEVGLLTKLKELHLQGNRLQVLPPSLALGHSTSAPTEESIGEASKRARPDWSGLSLGRQLIALEDNSLISDLLQAYRFGPTHLIDFIATRDYAVLYAQAGSLPPVANRKHAPAK